MKGVVYKKFGIRACKAGVANFLKNQRRQVAVTIAKVFIFGIEIKFLRFKQTQALSNFNFKRLFWVFSR